MAQSQPVARTRSTLVLLDEKGQRTEFARTAAVDSGNQLENKKGNRVKCGPSLQEQFDQETAGTMQTESAGAI